MSKRIISNRGALSRHVAGNHAVAGLAAIIVGMVPPAANALEPLSSLKFNLASGTTNLDLRLRYENVDQGDPLPAPITESKADSTTVRARLGYTTAKWNELVAQIEYEGLSVIGNQDFNSFTNGETEFPVVADAKVNELNQAWIRWSGLPKSEIKYGRQRILLDNQRFVGNVGWRQTEMTYDATLLTSTLIPKTKFTFAYLTNINSFRFFNFDTNPDPTVTALRSSNDVDIKAQLFNAAVTVIRNKLVLTPYLYQLDFDAIPVGAPAARLFQDSSTLGLRATGALPFDKLTFSYALEYASQQDYADSPSTIDFAYTLIEPALAYDIFKGTLGYEVLEGDGANSFQTPLATAHAFVGWADQFLITPPGGLVRTYASVGANVLEKKLALTAVYHQFESDEGSIDFGDEINLLAAYSVLPNFVLSAKYAAYSADAGDPAPGKPVADTDKLWLYAEYRF